MNKSNEAHDPAIQAVTFNNDGTFIGRLHDLHELQAYFNRNDILPAMISGPPGIGKSTFIRQFLQQYSTAKATWINAENEYTIVDSLSVRLSETLEADEYDQQWKRSATTIRDLTNKVCGTQEDIIVFDGAASVDAVRKYFPSENSKVKILITTRALLETNAVVCLGAFTKDESKDFLLSAFGTTNEPNDIECIKNLANACDGQPLALRLAASFINAEMGSTLAEKIADYISKLNEFNANDSFNITATVVEITRKHLSKFHGTSCAARILNMLVYFGTVNISPQVFLDLAGSKNSLTLAIDLLCKYHLITVVTNGLISMPPAYLQELVRSQQSETETINNLQSALKLFGTIPKMQLLNSFHPITSVWSYSRQYLANEFHAILVITMDQLMQADRWLEAELFGRQTVLELSEALEPNDMATIRMRSRCAEVFFHQKKYADALAGFNTVLGELTRLLGSDHTDTNEARLRCADALAARCEWTKACRLYEIELNRYNQFDGTDRPELRRKIEWIRQLEERHRGDEACVKMIFKLLAQCRYDAATELCENMNEPNYVLELRGTVRATIRQLLAILYHQKGDLTRARLINEVQLQEVLAEFGGNHKNILLPKRNIATILQDQGDLANASAMYNQVLNDCRQILGPDHPENLCIGRGLASLLRAQGKVSESLCAYETVLGHGELALGVDHPANLITKRCVAAIHQDLGHLDIALQIYKQVLAKSIQVLGRNHIDLLVTMRAIASVMYLLGRNDESWKLFKIVLKRGESLLGINHPDNTITRRAMTAIRVSSGHVETIVSHTSKPKMLVSLDAVPPLVASAAETVAEATNDFGYALKAYHNVLQHDTAAVSDTHAITDPSSTTDLITKCCSAAVMQEQGEYEAALRVYQEVFDRRVAVLGHDHPENLITKRAMAAVLQKQGKYDEAIRAYREILERGVKVLGADHADNSETMRNIVAVQRQKTKFKNVLAAFHAERKRASKFNTGFGMMLLLLVVSVVLWANEVYV